MKKTKLDLHVHTRFSPDAINTESDLELAFNSGMIDQIAVTDHDEIEGAFVFQEKFGPERIIIAEEMRTTGGPDIIGLFIHQFIPRGLSIERTCELIKNQNGLVYLPHPGMKKFGVGNDKLAQLIGAGLIDIVEIFNGWEHFSPFNLAGRIKHNTETETIANQLNIAKAAATDSHTPDSLGLSYTSINEPATRDNLLVQLQKTDAQDFVKVPNKLNINDGRAMYKRFKQKVLKRS